ncbi:MAG: helix-turn-helix domain-containing protein [Pseudonocardia sp.]
MANGDDAEPAHVDAGGGAAAQVEPALAELSQEIRRRRHEAGLSHGQLAARTGYTRQYVAMAERVKKSGVPSHHLIVAIDRALGAGGELIHIRSRAEEAKKRRRRDAIGAYDKSSVDVAAQLCVADSADERPDDEVMETATRRMFLKSLSGVAASALTGEFDDLLAFSGDVKPIDYYTAARRALVANDNIFGPRSVIPLVEQQITSASRSCRETQGADRVALLEVRAHFAEFNAWLYQDLGNHPLAKFWLDRALDWSYAHGQPELPTYTLARKSQLACDMRDPTMGVGIGELAIKSAPTPRLAAIATTYTAHSYAVNGQATASERLYESARELAGQAEDDGGDESGLGTWLDESYIDVHRAASLCELGQHHSAAEIYMQAIDRLAPGFHRDKGVYLARAANAYASAGDGAYAIDIGNCALRIALDTRSGRTLTELHRLSGQLATVTSAAAAILRAAVKNAAHPPTI